MYALLKTKSFIVTVSVRSLFFYSSVYDLKTIWMWEAMYCTVVMPYKNKMSSSSVSLDSLMEEREATERYDGRKISSLYLQNHLKTFLFFIAYSSSTRLQWEKDVLQKEGSASAVEFLSPEVNKPWAYALTRTYASSGYYSTTAFILVFVSFVHAQFYAAWMNWKSNTWREPKSTKSLIQRSELQMNSRLLKKHRHFE